MQISTRMFYQHSSYLPQLEITQIFIKGNEFLNAMFIYSQDRMFLAIKRNKIQIIAKHLKIIILNKRSPVQKTSHCIIPFIRNMRKSKENYGSLNAPSLEVGEMDWKGTKGSGRCTCRGSHLGGHCRWGELSRLQTKDFKGRHFQCNLILLQFGKSNSSQ